MGDPRSPFKSGYVVTQAFGVNYEFYGQFGLKGHEGIDLVPIFVANPSEWMVHALSDGIVVQEADSLDNPARAYGIWVTIWHPSLNLATRYCHMEYNTTIEGQRVDKGDVIGKMGNTGTISNGYHMLAHLHLNLYQTDSNGYRLNRDNGFLGGIDPLPFLEGKDD